MRSRFRKETNKWPNLLILKSKTRLQSHQKMNLGQEVKKKGQLHRLLQCGWRKSKKETQLDKKMIDFRYEYDQLVMWLFSMENTLLNDKLGSSPSGLLADFTCHPNTLQFSSELISIGNRLPEFVHFSFIKAPLLDQSFALRIKVSYPVANSAFLALNTSGRPGFRGKAKSTFVNGW